VGEGPEAAALKRLAEQLGSGERVRFLGSMPQERLSLVYSAADVLLLASSREGLPNVVLEALACGTPVVATAVWGTPVEQHGQPHPVHHDQVVAPQAGRQVRERTPEAIAGALRSVLADPPPRAAVRAYAERFAWGPTTAGQIRLFRSILDRAG
jgi:teichuronic acid biosynthesis glycosyltransferase TuaC